VTSAKTSNLVFQINLELALAALLPAALLQKFDGINLLFTPLDQLLGLRQ
jgi:hypothetical protein